MVGFVFSGSFVSLDHGFSLIWKNVYEMKASLRSWIKREVNVGKLNGVHGQVSSMTFFFICFSLIKNASLFWKGPFGWFPGSCQRD